MQSSPTGRGWPEGPGEGETARSWAQFVATARPSGLSLWFKLDTKCAILNGIAQPRRKIMGSSALERVRAEALNLSESERAELAHNLVASLDGPADSDAEKAWDAEIQRRLSEIDSETANLIDREEFRRRMRAPTPFS